MKKLIAILGLFLLFNSCGKKISPQKDLEMEITAISQEINLQAIRLSKGEMSENNYASVIDGLMPIYNKLCARYDSLYRNN